MVHLGSAGDSVASPRLTRKGMRREEKKDKEAERRTGLVQKKWRTLRKVFFLDGHWTLQIKQATSMGYCCVPFIVADSSSAISWRR